MTLRSGQVWKSNVYTGKRVIIAMVRRAGETPDQVAYELDDDLLCFKTVEWFEKWIAHELVSEG